ncbi:hypothetical protein WBG99_02370 [Streptomyces sp. TG1A-60]|uniref:hypothetical protein n=1 Tax=Streptomyces sp. TG1A-60 TaxID=3129111 RepID=UPI0030D5626D
MGEASMAGLIGRVTGEVGAGPVGEVTVQQPRGAELEASRREQQLRAGVRKRRPLAP